MAEERGSHRPAPLLLQRAEKRLILLLTVPKLPSAHRLAEVTAWESFPGVPVARGQQKRPPATASPWPQLSPITAAKRADKTAAGASSLLSGQRPQLPVSTDCFHGYRAKIGDAETVSIRELPSQPNSSG